MKNKYFLVSLAFLLSGISSGYSQFTTSNTAPYNSPFYLINDVFAGGNVTISNVTAYGQPSQYGFFTGNAVLGMDSGVVLSTGTINELCSGSCPNATGTAPGLTANTFGFPWMGAATNPGTNNNLYNVSASVPGLLGFGSSPSSANHAAVLSFDFVPTLDTMHFRFIFASHEWPSYPCSSFNDMFGFFVSGPGINGGYNSPVGYPNGAENFALVPGTNIPITITSINASGYSPASCTNSYQQYFVPNVASSTGITAHHTTIMEVEFVVQPCQTYNFTMGVADGSDGALSSFVLMEANSFNSTGVQVSFNATYNLGGDSILYEGCGSVDMEIIRSDNIPNADTIHFDISGNATNGVDYTLLPDSVIFQPGQSTFNHTFYIPNDFLTEGPETIMVFVTDTDLVTCTGTGDTLIITIQDPIPLTSDAWTDTINCTQAAQLAANPLTGLSPFTFQWNTGLTSDTINLTPTPLVSTDYIVTITDACSVFTLIDTAHLVILNPVMSINTPGDTITCESSGAPISVQITNQMPQTQIQWNTGHSYTPFWGFNPFVTTNYIVTVSQACSGQMLVDTFTLVVDNPPFTVTIEDDTINCTDPGTMLQAFVTNTTPNFDYLWDDGSTAQMRFVSPSVTTTYYFTATDACGVNSVSDSATVYVINDPIFTSSTNKSIQCIGDTATLEVNAIGGYPPYSYNWSNGSMDSTTMVVSTGANATYTVSVTDICGLTTVVESVDVIVVTYPKLEIDSMIGETFKCPNNPIAIGSTKVNGGSGDYKVSWDNWATTNDYLWAIVDSTTTFTIQAFDNCNFDTAFQTITYIVEKHDPLVVTLPADTHLCQQEQITLVANVTGGAGGYTYKWSNGSKNDEIKVRSNTNQTYSVTVTELCGNTASNEMSVEISQPTADFDHFFFDSYNAGFNNLSEDANFYLWNFGDGDTSTVENPLKEYTVSQEYNVQLIATDSFGCVDSILKKITPPLVAFVPNAFTPNGDGLNDYFQVYGSGFMKGYEVKEFRIVIYDRWGMEVFKSNSPDFQWDGSVNGEKANIDSYVYKITVEGFDRQKIDMTGTVNVLE
jgi:gliding motility-associated-like protein